MTTTRILALLTLAGLLPGQGTILLGADGDGQRPRQDQWLSPSTRNWPASVARNGSIHKLVTGRLTGHTLPDVLMLDGEEPVLITAPGIHTSFGPLPAGTSNGAITHLRDVAVLSGQGLADGSNSNLDALAMVSSSGLSIWRRNPNGGVVGVTQVGGAEWNSTQLIATHPLDSTRIFGVDSSGTVRMAVHTPCGYETSSITFPNCPSPLAIACIDWQGGSSGTEVAVLTTAGLSVFNSNGCTLVSFAASTSQGSLTLVRADTTVGSTPHAEWLAWLTPDPHSTLRICRDNAYQSIALPGHFVGATAAEWTGDTAEDLLLSTEHNTDVALVFNLFPYAPQAFDYNPAVTVRLAIASNEEVGHLRNSVGVAAADFDGDGDGDLIAFLDTGDTATKFTFLKCRIYDNPSAVQITNLDYTPDAGEDISQFDLTFLHAAGGTHTEVIVWTEEWPSNPGQLVPRPIDYQLIPKGSLGESTVTIEVPREHMLSGGVHMLMMRPVTVSQGQVTEVAKAFLGTITAQMGTPRAFAANGGSQSFIGDVRTGGIAPRPDLPPAPPGNPPDPE